MRVAPPIRLVLPMAALLLQPAPRPSYDVVVYGGTPAGVVAAVAAAREGVRVALLEPGGHLGGMMSGGLGESDIGDRPDVIGGYSLEVFTRIRRAYGLTGSPDPKDHTQWDFEPHVAEAAFDAMAREANVRVLFGERLRETGGVRTTGGRVVELVTERGTRLSAPVFVDATYEGDLMARAGVSYTWGREAASQYGESLAGVRAETPQHNFVTVGVRVRGLDDAGRPLAGVLASPRGAPGAGDRKVQAYNFRVTVTNVAANRVPFPEPRGYDPRRYELLRRLVDALGARNGRPPRMSDLLIVSPLPNGKFDVNNRGPVSTDHINASWGYPDGTYAERARIWQDHVEYVQGIFYFLANDPRVPRPLREEVRAFGLPRDEFADTDHFPRQLYVREARRMVGDLVMAQRDIQTDVTKPDAIGMGSYRSDSHNVQRFATDSGFAENEGNMEVTIVPYEIPYRVMLPKRREATNLLVPGAFSASHVAFSTVRMEPQWMIIGQAAGVAAAQAVRREVAVQDVDVEALRGRLREQRAVLSLPGR
jgi:hypothetical protein